MFCVVRACVISNKTYKPCFNIHEILQQTRWRLKGCLSEVFKLLSNVPISHDHNCCFATRGNTFSGFCSKSFEVWKRKLGQKHFFNSSFKSLNRTLRTVNWSYLIWNKKRNWHQIFFRNLPRYIKRYYRSTLWKRIGTRWLSYMSYISEIIWYSVVYIKELLLSFVERCFYMSP